MSDVHVVVGEAVVVGPEDRLLIKLPVDSDLDILQSLLDHLVEIGLKDRALVMCGDMEFAVLEADGE